MSKAGGGKQGGGPRLSLADLSALGAEDRIAVMNMFKDGEVTIDEAIARVKGEALLKAGKGAKDGFNRRGAVKKFRGRLNIELTVQKASAFSLLILNIKDGRDLLAMNKLGTADPYVKMYIVPDPSKASKRKTEVHKGTRNPIFNEQFQWEIRTGTDLEGKRLHIAVWDNQAWMKNQFMGSMSFALDELFGDADLVTTGWFKLLDEKKGEFQNIPYRPKRVLQPATPKVSTPSTSSVLSQPLPPLPPQQQTPVSRASQPLPPLPPQASQPTAAARPAVASPSVPQPALSHAASPQPSSSSLPVAVATPVAAARPLEKVSAASFNFTKVLGQGSFGKVMLAERKGSGEVYAIKAIKKDAVIEDDDVDCTMTERRVLALSSGNPFLTRLHATFQTPDRLFFVMEFVNGGDLMFHIQQLRVFKFEQAQFYCAEICSGLWYLHENGILYRDLKLDNVMLDGDGHIKIADFGMCKENIFGTGRTTTFCGTPGYLAPEIVQELPYNASVDFWSLGVLMFEMLIGDSPFDADDDDELFDQIQNKKLEYPKHLSAPSRALLDGFLNRDPSKRLGCGPNGKTDIKRHPFFDRLDWAKLEARQIPPPFKPNIKNPKEATNFDSEFTQADPNFTPVNPTTIKGIDQDLFNGFSFVNPTFGNFRGAAAPAPVAGGGPSAGNSRTGNYDQVILRDEPSAGGGSSLAALAPPPAPSASGYVDLRRYKWYRPDIPRQDVAAHLKGKPPGTFFVRESSSQPGCYALAMEVGGDKPWNGLITPTVDQEGVTRYRLFVAKKFNNLPELITHYSQNVVTADARGRDICLLLP